MRLVYTSVHLSVHLSTHVSACLSGRPSTHRPTLEIELTKCYEGHWDLLFGDDPRSVEARSLAPDPSSGHSSPLLGSGAKQSFILELLLPPRFAVVARLCFARRHCRHRFGANLTRLQVQRLASRPLLSSCHELNLKIDAKLF